MDDPVQPSYRLVQGPQQRPEAKGFGMAREELTRLTGNGSGECGQGFGEVA
jgi:hypothetical protein